MENNFNKYENYPVQSCLTINNKEQDHILDQIEIIENKLGQLISKKNLNENLFDDLKILKNFVIHNQINAALSLINLMRNKVQNVLSQSFFPLRKLQILMTDLIELQQNLFYAIKIKEVLSVDQYTNDENVRLYISRIEDFQIIVEDNIDIGEIIIPENSNITGETTITALECKPIIENENNINMIGIKFIFMIQEKFVIKTPDKRKIPLEFNYRTKRIQFYNIKTEELNICKDINIEIARINATHKVILNSSSPGKQQASLDEQLIIDITIQFI